MPYISILILQRASQEDSFIDKKTDLYIYPSRHAHIHNHTSSFFPLRTKIFSGSLLSLLLTFLFATCHKTYHPRRHAIAKSRWMLSLMMPFHRIFNFQDRNLFVILLRLRYPHEFGTAVRSFLGTWASEMLRLSGFQFCNEKLGIVL